MFLIFGNAFPIIRSKANGREIFFVVKIAITSIIGPTKTNRFRR
jgi:hypothetical protein